MPTFTLQSANNRYQAVLDERVVGTLKYSMVGKKMVIERTETADDVRGQGIARRLTRFAFDDARTKGLIVDPKCSYAKRFVDQHPEYSDVL